MAEVGHRHLRLAGRASCCARCSCTPTGRDHGLRRRLPVRADNRTRPGRSPIPAGLPLEQVRAIRDEIELRVRDLIDTRLDAIRTDPTAHQFRLVHLLPQARRRVRGKCGLRRRSAPARTRSCPSSTKPPVRSYVQVLAYRRTRECLRTGNLRSVVGRVQLRSRLNATGRRFRRGDHRHPRQPARPGGHARAHRRARASRSFTAAATSSATARTRTRSARLIADRGIPKHLRQLRLRDRARSRRLRLCVHHSGGPRARPALGGLDARTHRPALQGLHARVAVRRPLPASANATPIWSTDHRARSTNTYSRTSQPALRAARRAPRATRCSSSVTPTSRGSTSTEACCSSTADRWASPRTAIRAQPSRSSRSAPTGIEVTIERVAYDAEAVAREVAAVGLPAEYADKLLIAA